MPSGIPGIDLSEYTYVLPPDRIAFYPLSQRDSSRLLVVKDGVISEDIFRRLPVFLPSDAKLVLNETRVVQARLVFHKESGARVEVFCLEPLQPYPEIYSAFSSPSPVVWRCLVGNARKWKSGELRMELPGGGRLSISQVQTEADTRQILFSWEPEHLSFGEVLESVGKTPLPPYINRQAEAADKERYQTVFAMKDGSVAAPTAGLHFSPAVFEALNEKNISLLKLNLHVGAGTFKPISSSALADHHMHREQMAIPVETIERLATEDAPVIAVGTTSVRTLESLYWFGVKLLRNPLETFQIEQWEPYSTEARLSRREAAQRVLEYCRAKHLDELQGITGLMIVPGYRFKMTDLLITNFHQPRSSLLLLVAAFAGDNWRKAYDYAIEKKFRMLSYGDSCLFFPYQ